MEYVIFRCQMLRWFNIIGCIWVCAKATQSCLVLFILQGSRSDFFQEFFIPFDGWDRAYTCSGNAVYGLVFRISVLFWSYIFCFEYGFGFSIPLFF